MRPISIVCLLLLLDWEAVAQAPQPTDSAKTTNKEKCTVAGTVVRLDSGAPLKKATVVLSSNESRGRSVFAMTDDQGSFEFDNVEPGSYGLSASHDGFVTSFYGQRKPDNPGANLTLARGQRMTDLVFKLLRSASMSGHVMDEDGEPLPNVQVIPFHASSQRGRSGLGAAGETLTNDLGEYRIFGLNPGRYYIRANYHPLRNRLGNPSPTRISKEAYPPTFYPNTIDPAKAAAIIVKAGDEIPALDFILKPSPVVTVTGKVSNAATDQSGVLSLSVSLIPRGLIISRDDATMHTEVSNKMGVFEFRDVFPGSYTVRAFGIINQEQFSTRRELDIGGSDVEGVNLTITRSAEVPGRIIWEGLPTTEVQDVYVTLWTGDDSPYSPNLGASLSSKADGSFLIKNVPEGVYRPRVFTKNPDCFVRSARYGSAEVVDGGLVIHPGTDTSLELKMSCRAAQIEGTVVTVDSLPAAGVYVVAIPDAPHRDQQWKYLSETTDQNGKFLLRGLLPGEYRIFSWDSGDDFDWYNAGQLNRMRAKVYPSASRKVTERPCSLQLSRPTLPCSRCNSTW